jgi:hypothetical protein
VSLWLHLRYFSVGMLCFFYCDIISVITVTQEYMLILECLHNGVVSNFITISGDLSPDDIALAEYLSLPTLNGEKLQDRDEGVLSFEAMASILFCSNSKEAAKESSSTVNCQSFSSLGMKLLEAVQYFQSAHSMAIFSIVSLVRKFRYDYFAPFYLLIAIIVERRVIRMHHVVAIDSLTKTIFGEYCFAQRADGVLNSSREYMRAAYSYKSSIG